MVEARNTLLEKGFIQLNQLLEVNVCKRLFTTILSRLYKFAEMHECTIENYFSVVNRWPLTNILDSSSVSFIINTVQTKIAPILQNKFEAFEIDVLYKSPVVSLATPVHQDISYVWQKPYAFSTWVGLNNISLEDSALQFLAYSHHEEIQPAIDFWQPNFIDKIRKSFRWQQEAITIPTSISNGFLFSSRILHASQPHTSQQERLAIVIRWGNISSLQTVVPKPLQVPFGMWNCGEKTEKLLRDGLEKIYGYNITGIEAIISAWIQRLEKESLPFYCNCQLAIEALKKLKILNTAYRIYGGGDGQGIVYAKLWHSLLVFLKKELAY